MAEHRDTAFRIDVDLGGPVRNSLFRAVRPALEKISGLDSLTRLYRGIPEHLTGTGMLRRALADLGVRFEISEADRARLPRNGPVVVVANHPYGAVEGMILAVVLQSVRPDARLLVNFLLGRIPELRELFVYVDPFESDAAVRNNLGAMRAAMRYVGQGGMLGVFPAGEVAHLYLRRGRVVDPPWSSTVARVVRHAEATVVPVFFSGHNGALFQVAGMLHPRMRTALLPRQMFNRRGGAIEVRVGAPIQFGKLRGFEDDAALMGYLRDRTEIQRHRLPSPAVRGEPVQPRRTPTETVALADPAPADLLRREVERLPEDAHLASDDSNDVFVARASEIPNVLRELGRLREQSFRSVGEGTGRRLDIDRFDDTYEHLFAWNRDASEVVGAYRLGRTDELIASGGLDALYTSTLFAYRPDLFRSMGPALEMGRSFIRAKYQRSYTALLLLWKGIGRYVVRNPRYATLFGPVSISAGYRGASQRLLVAFLEQNRYAHPWSRHVRPRRPYHASRRDAGRPHPENLRDLDDVAAFIQDIEADQKGVPVLLKQYLKLGGRLLGFNVDPEFSSVLDVLIVVDLRDTPRRILSRYMGRRDTAAFLAGHAGRTPPGS